MHFENSLRDAGLDSVELLASAGREPPVAAPTCSEAGWQQAGRPDGQDRAARSAMSERQAAPLSPQEGQGGATAGQGQQAAAAASARELTEHASASPVRKRARHVLAAADKAAAAGATAPAAAAPRGPHRQQPPQAESLSAAAGDGRLQSRSPVASQSLHSHFQSRLQAAGLDSVDLLQLARHQEVTTSEGEPGSASGQGCPPNP